MAARARTSLTGRKTVRGAPDKRPSAGPLLYTAQDLARFCEVDLKTIHHWADADKVAHYRTEGRHLRFRRNHVVAFLRKHGYPLPDELVSARPTVFHAYATRAEASRGVAEELAKKLASRFFVRRFETALDASVHLFDGEPDAILVGFDDPSWTGAGALRILKSRTDTSWPIFVVVSEGATPVEIAELTAAGADLVLDVAEVYRVPTELAKLLAVG